jgi:V/A-type H+-transporting ATPase subunit F
VKKIVFLTPADARYGFALAGVRQLVTTREELPSTLVALEHDPDIGVLVVDERLTEGPGRAQLRETEHRWPGLVVVLPAPGKKARADEEDYARQLIRRAVGYQVRVNL